jgi:flagella basal body P-ring formation protein FlgA
MTAPTLPARPTLPPSNPVRAQPVAVMPGPNTAARARVRTQWLLLAAALTVLAGTLVAWALSQAAARVDVVSIARPVPAGAVIDAADLSVTAIAFDEQVTGLVPAASRERLVGRTAAIALEPGTLLSVGMWADGSQLGDGERTVIPSHYGFRFLRCEPHPKSRNDEKQEESAD